MLRLRLWLCEPDGSLVREIRAQKVSYTASENGDPTLSFTVARGVVGDLPYLPIVVRVEWSHGEGYAPVPRDDYFIMLSTDVEKGVPSDTATYTGRGYLPWQLSLALLRWGAGAKDGERLWTDGGDPVSAGTIISGMIDEAQGRGALANLTYSFTSSKDSAAQSWSSAEKVKQSWRMLDPVLKHLDALAQQGLCDWGTTGLELCLWRPGSGTNLTGKVVFDTVNMTRVPVTADASDLFTHLVVASDKLKNWVGITNTGAPTAFGTLEAAMSQSGVADETTATRMAQPTLERGRTITIEDSFEWTPGDTRLCPWRDFALGDTVMVNLDGVRTPRRLVALTITQETGAASVRVVTGRRIRGGSPRARASTLGSFVGGSGTPITIAPSLPIPAPKAPTDLHVVSNVGGWGPDGSAVGLVTVGWDAVTEAVDGSDIDTPSYDVWLAVGSGAAQRATMTGATTALLTLQPGQEVTVTVRAEAGVYGEFSSGLAVTPASPDTAPPAPSDPVLSIEAGTVAAAWDGNDKDNQAYEAGLAYVYAAYSTSEHGTYTQAGTFQAAGAILLTGLTPGTWWVRLYAVSRVGSVSAASGAQSILLTARIPEAPTNLVVTTTSSWRADGTATAALTASWDAVTVDTDGAEITVDLYRAMVRLDTGTEQVAGSTPASSIELTGYSPDVDYEVSVQARSEGGSWSALTDWAQVTPGAPTSALAAPATPEGASLLGLVVGTWNGLLGGSEPPHHFAHVRWEASTDSGVTWINMDQPAVRAGDSTFRGFDIGTVVMLRLVAVAVDGTESEPSETVTVMVVGSEATAVLEAHSIVANLIRAGALTVNELSPSVGDELTMTAAGGVAIRISDMVNDQRQRYDFGAEGLIITEPGSLLSVALSSEQIAMMQGEEIVSWWEAQVMHVPQIEISGGTIVNHTVSSDGAGGTVWMVA